MSPGSHTGTDPDLQHLLTRSDRIFEETRRLVQSGSLTPEQISYLDSETENLIRDSEAILDKLRSRD
jgi:hypothetical protein